MRHLNSGRQLGVDSSHRIALLRSLTLALIEKEAIKTTVAKAKELRWYADRVVTLAKRGNLHGRRTIVKLLGSTHTQHSGENRVRTAIDRIYTELVPRFQTRPGGYTQIMRIDGRRAGDNAEMCMIRYIPGDEKAAKAKPAKKEAKSKDSKKKVEASAKGDKASKAPQDKPTKAKKKDKESAE